MSVLFVFLLFELSMCRCGGVVEERSRNVFFERGPEPARQAPMEPRMQMPLRESGTRVPLVELLSIIVQV